MSGPTTDTFESMMMPQERFSSIRPDVMDEVMRTLRELHTCGSQLTISDDETRLACTVVHVMRGIHALSQEIQRTGEWTGDLRRLRRLMKTMRFALLDEEHNGFFETMAVPGDGLWPDHATPTQSSEFDQPVYQQHTDIGILYGSPCLFDGCVYLWHREERTAADHLFAVLVPDVPAHLTNDPRLEE